MLIFINLLKISRRSSFRCKYTVTSINSVRMGYQTSAKAEDGAGADYFVDLRSDTVTKPSEAMRKAMASAMVGDDVYLEDPTAQELEKRMATLLGKEASLFLPSGTMSNLLAVLVHCPKRGAELIVGDKSHMFQYEQGGISQFGGVHSNQIANEPDGTFSIEGVLERIRSDDIHSTITSLIAVENTHNWCGGRVIPLKWLDEITKVGKTHGIPLHMDGARLFNSVIATGETPRRITQGFDSVSVCLSKNLGAPIGSLLVGDSKFILQARRLRKALGGGMRQIGIIAAAGLYSLDHMIDRIKEDHENATAMAQIINNINNPNVFVDKVETNMLLLNVGKYPVNDFCARLAKMDESENDALGKTISILSTPCSVTVIRLVLHCDVSSEMAIKAAQKICFVTEEFAKSLGT